MTVFARSYSRQIGTTSLETLMNAHPGEIKAPEALVLIADDQNEQFTGTVLPQIAVYTGPDLLVGRHVADAVRTRSHPALAAAILFATLAAAEDLKLDPQPLLLPKQNILDIIAHYASTRTGSLHLAQVDLVLLRDPACQWRCLDAC